MRQIVLITLRGTAEEKQSLEAEADEAGLSLNDYVRGCLGLNQWRRLPNGESGTGTSTDRGDIVDP